MPVKCPWCGRLVKVHRGRIFPHVVTKGVRCVGGGFEWAPLAELEHLTGGPRAARAATIGPKRKRR